MSVRENFADIYLRGVRDRSIRSGTELAREIQLTDWSTAVNLSNRSSGVEIPRDICTCFERYLYSKNLYRTCDTPYVTVSQLTRIDQSLFYSPLLVQRVLSLSYFRSKNLLTCLRFQYHKSRHLSRQIKNVTLSTINNVTLSQISV